MSMAGTKFFTRCHVIYLLCPKFFFLVKERWTIEPRISIRETRLIFSISLLDLLYSLRKASHSTPLRRSQSESHRYEQLQIYYIGDVPNESRLGRITPQEPSVGIVVCTAAFSSRRGIENTLSGATLVLEQISDS